MNASIISTQFIVAFMTIDDSPWSKKKSYCTPNPLSDTIHVASGHHDSNLATPSESLQDVLLNSDNKIIYHTTVICGHVCGRLKIVYFDRRPYVIKQYKKNVLVSAYYIHKWVCYCHIPVRNHLKIGNCFVEHQFCMELH